MNKFKPPVMTRLSEVIGYLRQFVPALGRELETIRRSIPAKGLSLEEIAAALLENPEFKDAVYRYIKDREARE